MTGLKDFLREDGVLNDGLIEMLQDSAEAELLASGVPKYVETDPEYPVYKICLFLMVSRDYDKRVLEDVEQRTLDKNILRIRKFPSSTEEGGS
ncbi:head-tail connector protein [Salinicoccus sp. HZC-1]|uniref:head-tail connector protein n=1 Tax=Salinicoccus sp. HZC-1 TaxID=3385497 RepID=UPI00398A6D62